MLEAMDFIVKHRVKQCNDEDECLKKIGYVNKNNIYQVRKGTRGFTHQHISKMCSYYGVDANFIYVLAHKTMFRQNQVQTPIELLQQALNLMQKKK